MYSDNSETIPKNNLTAQNVKEHEPESLKKRIMKIVIQQLNDVD